MRMKTTTFLFLLACCALLIPSDAFQAKHQAMDRGLIRSESACSSKPASLKAINGERNKKSGKNSSDEATNYNYIGLNTNKETPYVPSGLSPEQYNAIKKGEAAKQATMDFGAWGPRFKRSDAPDGDWMVNANLWVRGFASTSDTEGEKSSITEEEVKQRERRQRQLASLRTTMTSMLLAYAVLEIMLLSVSAVRSGVPGIVQALQRRLLSRPTITLDLLKFSKLTLVKLALAAMASPLVNLYRERANRRWLWSRWQMVGTPLVVAVGVFSLRMALAFAMGGAGLR